MQEKEVFETVASPTISLVAVFIIIALTAMKNRFVGAAYLEVEMDMTDENNEILMAIEPFVASLQKELDPTVAPYLDENGRLVVRLRKALYGLVQSAILWYRRLRGVLKAAG